MKRVRFKIGQVNTRIISPCVYVNVYSPYSNKVTGMSFTPVNHDLIFHTPDVVGKLHFPIHCKQHDYIKDITHDAGIAAMKKMHDELSREFSSYEQYLEATRR